MNVVHVSLTTFVIIVISKVTGERTAMRLVLKLSRLGLVVVPSQQCSLHLLLSR